MDLLHTLWLAIVAMLSVACGAQIAAPTLGPGSPAASATAPPSEVASATPVVRDAAEGSCRERVVAQTNVDPAALAPVLHASSPLATFVLFSNGSQEFSCFAYPDAHAPSGFGMMTNATQDHVPDRLTRTQLAIVIGNGYTSDVQFAGWLWGVAAPVVSELTVTSREGATGTIGEVGHTFLQNGYFFTIFDGPCCVGNFVTIVGLDSSGSEVFRSPAE